MIRFNVPDMTCGACANRIGRALAQAGLPADLQVEIDVAARQVRLPLAAPGAVAQAVRQAIVQAGYTAEPAAPARQAPAAARTGGCCCAARRAAAVDASQAAQGRSAGCCA